ncbi:uncharacterized protein LOC126557069 [Anopheles maculipalpis]|uniref:uncharacterized protein LOC126557069 n=1 Tax=Anopheles maculipalpis TaxID=1496333 RepID=UPI00215928CA|nr:uncharacterized protein LOC126557069 [Anopheles maculipalpis]
MPRLKKRVEEAPVVVPRTREIPETLTAGRARRTIKPNPKYMNDEMLIPTRNTIEEEEQEELDMSGDEYIVDYEENDDPEDSGLVIRKSVVTSTPQTTYGQPRRRGRPPKQKNLDAPRTEPVKNLRKEVLKKMDYKTISISKSRHMGSQFLDGRRKLNLTADSIDGDSADQDEMDDMEMEEHSLRSSQKALNAASLKKHLIGNIGDRRSSMANRRSEHDGTTEEEEYDDEGEFVNDSDAKLSEPEPTEKVKRPVGRPRKHPVKQVSPFGGKVLLPGMKTSTTSSTPILKRKAIQMDEVQQEESQQSKMLRRSYGMKSVSGGGGGGGETSSKTVEIESDENSEGREKQLKRSASFQTLPRGRPPKNASNSVQPGVKSERNVTQGNRSFPEVKPSKPTITIVNVNDIMKMNSKSAADLRRKLAEEEADSEDVSEIEEMQTDHPQDDAKTNNQLVASILERKRPIALEHLQSVRRRVRESGGEMVRNRVVELKPKRVGRDGSDMLTEEDMVDFEDVLQKNIVSANKGARSITVGAVRGRGRPPSHTPQDENYSAGSPTRRFQPGGNRVSVAGKPVGNQRRSLQPPRILNATMKLGDNHPRSKMSGGSGDNHYSIDLSDPDNNVKLVSSSNENTPIKRSPAASGPVAPTLSQKLAAGVGSVAKAMLGGVRTRSPLEPKKKRVTVYETWNVLQIKSIDSTLKPPHLALSMISLGNIADEIKLPSSAWSYRTVVEQRKIPPADGDEVFIGKTADITIREEDRIKYVPNKIVFRRKAASPGRFNVQYDRSVTFCDDTYKLNVDGQFCKLVAAPSRLETVEDIETLLMIVDYVDPRNGCLDLPASARMQIARDAATMANKRSIGSKDPVII